MSGAETAIAFAPLLLAVAGGAAMTPACLRDPSSRARGVQGRAPEIRSVLSSSISACGCAQAQRYDAPSSRRRCPDAKAMRAVDIYVDQRRGPPQDEDLSS